MKKCPFCAEEIQDEAIKCRHCGEWLKEQQTICEGKEIQQIPFINYLEELKWIGGSDELNYYLLNCEGISKPGLHIRAYIGLLLPFQWFIIIIFNRLGRLRFGILYFIPIGASYVFYFIPKYEIIVLVGAIIYIIAWVHSAKILHRYQYGARKRILEIDQKEEINIDEMLEKGIILGKALFESEYAVKVFNEALKMPNGNPFLFNLSGDIMRNNKKIKLAVELYKKAIELAKDENLFNQIKANLGSVGITSF